MTMLKGGVLHLAKILGMNLWIRRKYQGWPPFWGLILLLLKTMFGGFPLLLLKGIHHWTYALTLSRGRNSKGWVCLLRAAKIKFGGFYGKSRRTPPPILGALIRDPSGGDGHFAALRGAERPLDQLCLGNEPYMSQNGTLKVGKDIGGWKPSGSLFFFLVGVEW